MVACDAVGQGSILAQRMFFFLFFLFRKVKFLAPSFVKPVYDDSPDDP